MIVKSLTIVPDDELLAEVKAASGMGTAAHLDKTLKPYIYDVKLYLLSAGVSEDVVASTLAVGCITRGVMDTWNYGNGDTELSTHFYERANQLKKIETDGAINSYSDLLKQIADLTNSYNVLLQDNEALRAEVEIYKRDSEELAEIERMIDESGVLT